jgi:hypothetical protein
MLKRSGRTDADVMREVVDVIVEWTRLQTSPNLH